MLVVLYPLPNFERSSEQLLFLQSYVRMSYYGCFYQVTT